jgi:hypothetical protein
MFCGQHLRDKYRLEEVEKGIKYCDISRGCFTLLTGEYTSCEACREKERQISTIRRNNRIAQNKQIAATHATNQRLCVKCNKEFEKFTTQKGKESHKCPRCFEMQTKVELARAPRERIYKAEMMANMKLHYANYIKNAICRDRVITIQFDEFCAIVVKPCYYCGEINSGEVNGIDRINNDIGYTSENCVPCCEICNRMKHAFHPLFFVDKCKILCRLKTATPDFYKKWEIYYKQKTKSSYNLYKHGATERSIEFHLSEEQFVSMSRMPCYLCGYVNPKGNGIDRVDSSLGYETSNCKPCCWSCNISKSDFKLTSIIAKCASVAARWDDITTFETIPCVLNTLKSAHNEHSESTIKVWKAATLYKALQENNYQEYINSNSKYVSDDDMIKLINDTKMQSSDEAIVHIKKFIAKINMRRKRAA